MAFAVAGLGFIVGAKLQFRLETTPSWRIGSLLHDVALIEPGGRTPLAVAMGAAFAALWCYGRRLNWREVGDSLALAAVVGLSLGRLGCVVNGCCLGIVCPTWLSPICTFPSPGSRAYMAQLSTSAVATVSPVVPLSSLFVAVGLGIAALLFWQIRHEAPAGRVLATSLVLSPLAKALLELLRGHPRPPALMVYFPLACFIAAAVAWLLAIGRSRRAAQDVATVQA